MLDGALWGEPVAPYYSPNVSAQIATERWQLDGYYALRRAIFAEEQGLFDVSDVDAFDRIATPIVALSHSAGMPDDVIGGVRIYPAEGGLWYGGRLGVHRRYRSRGVVGSSLIFAAVSTAHALGCMRFLATIQVQNVPYFERHCFFCIEPIEVCGQPHQLMEADLGAYPPRIALASRPVDGAHAAAELRKRRAA